MFMKKLLLFTFFILLFFTSVYSQKQVCSTVLPEIKTSLDTSHMRGLADNYYLWDNGQNIYIKFLSGSNALQNKIKVFSKEWGKYANIKFVFVSKGNSNVRINLDSNGGHNSSIGTLANSVSQGEKTMNLDTTDFINDTILKRTVLHEFGHVLGLLHEHFNPVSGISWNKDSVYEDLYKSDGWDKEKVDNNIFQVYKLSYTNGTLYDELSIMEYPISPNWTTNGYSVSWNNDLSNGDKILIGALYPFRGKRIKEVPRFQITSLKNIEIINSKIKDGLLIYPNFTISTAGKEGSVYFIVSFYYSDGTPIKTLSDKYTIDSNIATFKVCTLPPNMHIRANNGKHDFELYIPYSIFPLPTWKNDIIAKFAALLYDNGEIKLLSSSSPVNCIIVK
jgi:hypothetical protein